VRDSRGFTLIEVLLVLVIIGILSAISMANYRHARLRGAETSAIGALSAINQAQFAYMQTCGNQKFAPHLTSLGKPHPGTTAAYLSPDLTGADEVVKSGYRIAMDGAEVTGNRFFGTNVDLVIYENLETFDGRMPDSGAPTLGQEVRGVIR
jgi:prepilin-type N-terminal cleavage/methylation domain-containing protein